MFGILVIEDNASQRAALEEFLESFFKSRSRETGEEYKIYLAENGELARAVFSERAIDLIISDLMLPDATGIELMKEFRSHKDVPVLIVTGEPSIESAVEAIQQGANDYLTKPVDLRLLKSKVTALLENLQLKAENQNLRERLSDTFSAESIIGHSSSLREVIDKCRQIAPADVTVLIEGESGTGKEMIANLIHENSARARRPFVKVNCGAITKTLLESELFGVVKGAYTGADKSRAGYFESANGGTIFLDEIGEMDPDSQVRLLRVIEEREVTRLGSTNAIPVDVRILAATNRNLLTAVDEGDFREDLYYRLAVIKLQLPPLRERSEDIPVLFNHFVTGFNDKYNKSVTGLAPDLLSFFQAYHWPGNIRQFRNVIEGMVVLAGDDILQKQELPSEFKEAPRSGNKNLDDSIMAGVSIEDYEKAIIARNLRMNHGNRERTAKILGISERTLYRKIKDFDLN